MIGSKLVRKKSQRNPILFSSIFLFFLFSFSPLSSYLLVPSIRPPKIVYSPSFHSIYSLTYLYTSLSTYPSISAHIHATSSPSYPPIYPSDLPANHLPTHPYTYYHQSITNPSIHVLNHPSIHSFIPPPFHTSTHPSIPQPYHPPNHPSSHSPTHQSIHPPN